MGYILYLTLFFGPSELIFEVNNNIFQLHFQNFKNKALYTYNLPYLKSSTPKAIQLQMRHIIYAFLGF